MVSLCYCWFLHTWVQAHSEQWAWVGKSSALWYIIHGRVQNVGSNSCWWQKLQLCTLFPPNGFWEQRGSDPNNNDRKGFIIMIGGDLLIVKVPLDQIHSSQMRVSLSCFLPAALFSCKVMDRLAGIYLGKTNSDNNLQILRNFEGKHF